MSIEPAEVVEGFTPTTAPILGSDAGVKVAIVGVRSLPHDTFPGDTLVQIDGALLNASFEQEFTVSKIVTGDRPGTDAAVRSFCEITGCEVTVLDDREGLDRNSAIVAEADHIVALWDGSSGDIYDLISQARAVCGDDRVYVDGVGSAQDESSDDLLRRVRPAQ